ncbi:hypothetical protein phiV208_32 [Vibrio phage phiV208]|nr:hypothetical protein phiV208_32 [Vibrio phage phiV208]
MNQPLDKGRVSVIVDKYQTNQLDQQGQPIMKNRYATVGRATMWPADNGRTQPNIDIEIDTIPIGATAPLKFFIFWDSESNQQQPMQQQTQQQQGGWGQPQQPQYGQYR